MVQATGLHRRKKAFTIEKRILKMKKIIHTSLLLMKMDLNFSCIDSGKKGGFINFMLSNI